MLEAMPLTPNRKIDRRAFPDPHVELRPQAPFAAPRTALEGELTRLFAEVLGLECVGIDDDFFECGGASIATLQLAARADEAGIVIAPELIFEHRTVRALAASLMAAPPWEQEGEDARAKRGAS